MIVRVNQLERGTRTAKSGNVQTGLWIRGVKLDQYGQDEKNWEKFLPEEYNANHIAVFEQIGIGNTVNIKMVKNGNFWNVDSVSLDEPSSEGGQPQGSGPHPDAGGGQKQTSFIPQPGKAPTSAKTAAWHIRNSAMHTAIALLGKMVDLQAAGVAVFPKTKMGSQIIEDSVMATAKRIEEYIGGKKEVATKSDSQDLVEEPISIPDDDIPF